MYNSSIQLSQFRPKQARSKARREALLKYGAELFETFELDEFSIAELTESLGFSTGSFYSYFRDKTTYFIELQEWVQKNLDVDFENTFKHQSFAKKSVIDRCRVCIEFALLYLRKHTGLVRSALRYERRIPAAWAPSRARTVEIISIATLGLSNEDKRRLEISLQMGFGLLVNSILHNPGPLRLEDPKLENEILAVLLPYLKGN